MSADPSMGNAASRRDRASQISVLIPAFNEEKRVGEAIGSARDAFERLGEPPPEIVVCDNNSSDATAEVAKAAGAKVVFEPRNQIARARNAAAKSASGVWLIFIDADSWLTPELLRETLARIRSGKTGAGGARVAFDRTDLGWHIKCGLAAWNAISRTLQLAAGSYVFCRREAWEAVGGFDEAYFAGEEIPFSRALKQWCRMRNLCFTIIAQTALPTSSRKLDSYSPLALLKLTLSLAWPGAVKNRERCDFWYRRKEP